MINLARKNLEAESSRVALRIMLIYAIVAGLWILFSDELLSALVSDQRLLTRISIFKGLFFVLVTALLLHWLIRRYLRTIRAKDEKLQTIAQGVAGVTGEKFFATLVKHLAQALEVDYAFVAELCDGDPPTMRTIDVFGKGELQENFTYSLAGTPCADVIKGVGTGCFFTEGVARKFPGDNLLAKMGVEGYIGTPLRSSSGQTMGVLAALNCRPLVNVEFARSLFQLFAVRAAAELERRHTEEVLRKAAVTYRIVADNTYNWEFWVNPEGQFVYASPSCERVTGHLPAEFLADPGLLEELIYPDDRGLMATHSHDIRSDSALEAIDFRIVRADGEVRWLHHVCQPVFDDAGTFLGRRGSNLDITEQKEAEEALLAQFTQMSTIFDSLHTLVYVADLETNELLYLNKYGTTLFGTDWQGKKCFEVLQAGDTSPCDYCTNDRLVRDGQPQPDCVWEFHNSVTDRWYQCIDRAITWPDGRLVRLEIAVDISERKQVEQLKDEIISAVSHEMRTPLTAMMGFTEFLLEQEVDPAQQKTYLNTVYKETRRLNELISNFLDLQQMKARLVTYRFAPLDVPPLLKDAAALFSFDREEHRIVIDCPAELPPVRGDEARLHQVLANLLSNAIKYSPRETDVTLSARSEGSEVVICVQDKGKGIPAELRERIFDKFYRVDNTDRRLVGGTGLGLALVRELVAAHDGRVWVESTVGAGSTFCVALPVTDAEDKGD
ncbi:MAG TPA: ATP-binding protein [Geobacteraceae bacterium]